MRRPRFTIRTLMLATAIVALTLWLGIRVRETEGIMRCILLVNIAIGGISAIGLFALNRSR